MLAAALVQTGAAASLQHPDDLWSPPAGAIAYWVVDPSALEAPTTADPNRAMLEASLLAVVGGLFNFEEPGPSPAASLLDPSVLQDAPYRAVLLDLTVDSGADPSPGNIVKLSALSLLIEIRTPDRHAQIESVLRAAAAAWAEANSTEVTEEFVDLGAGRTGTILRSQEGDDRFHLEWVGGPESFTVGVGKNALRQWHLETDDAPGPWTPHRDAAAPIHRDSLPVFEAFIDLDRLRGSIPDEVGWGTTGELMRAWRISNARSLALTLSASEEPENGPRLLNASISWADRSKPTGNARALQFSSPEWPATLGAPPAGAAYAIVLPSAWMTWIPMGIDTYRALHPEDHGFQQRSVQWLRRHLPPLERVIAQGQGVIAVVGPGDAVTGPAVLIPLRRGAPTARVRTDLRKVLGSLGPIATFAPESQAWSLDGPGDHRLFIGVRDEQLLAAWSADGLPAAGRPAP